MNRTIYLTAMFGPLLLMLSGCMTSVPMGPRVSVMPAAGKPFDLFAAEDRICRQYAAQSIGSTPDEIASQNAVGSTVAGVAIGSAVGALAGGHEGAQTGAAVGLIAGSSEGSANAAYASRDAQWRYDLAYQQCMYAKGNQIPGYQTPRQILPPPPPPPPPQ